jgi:hypothetical protein
MRAWVEQQRRRVEQTPVTRMDRLTEGASVAVEGKAVARGPLLTSPILGTAVLGYRIIIESQRPGEAKKTYDVIRLVDFEVVDAAGRSVGVTARNCELVLGHEYTQTGQQAGSAIRGALQLIAEQAGPEALHGELPALRWHEYYLQQGEDCYVCGACRMVVDVDGQAVTYRESAMRPTMVAPPEGQPMLVADMGRARLLGYLQSLAERS